MVVTVLGRQGSITLITAGNQATLTYVQVFKLIIVKYIERVPRYASKILV